ncbi:DUF5949 family protein [Streptomyces sp. WM6378]|uniref:DUF5949 family protein n=1 Tax=Streptomyces sp. WM6378 TaxID=1415557 RepID=UPI0006AEBBBF|nr:DUF5949 family protein [Streptomyces sp. WM6378]KOU39214.1 hypothetical protein ADK54_26445 [Streptomyces sp. WM6378]
MTSPASAVEPSRAVLLGSVVVIAWSGEHPDETGDVPFLMAYSLGDGTEGPEGAEAAARALLDELGMPAGSVLDKDRGAALPVTLIVQGGQAVLTMPSLTVQCPVPPEWLVAAGKRGTVQFMFATRSWPRARPGIAVSEEQLRAFAGDEDTISTAGHCVLPVRRLRG